MSFRPKILYLPRPNRRLVEACFYLFHHLLPVSFLLDLLDSLPGLHEFLSGLLGPLDTPFHLTGASEPVTLSGPVDKNVFITQLVIQ